MHPSILALLLPLMASAHATDPQPDNSVLFVGSSTVQFWGDSIQSDFPRLKPVDVGVWGTDFPFLLGEAAGWAEKYPGVRQIVIYSGDNDIANGNSPRQVANDFAKVASLLHEKFPLAWLRVVSVKPSLARENVIEQTRQANALIEKKARSLGYVDYVDVHAAMLDSSAKPRRELFKADGLHMLHPGYELWTRLLSPALLRCENATDLAGRAEAELDAVLSDHNGVPALRAVRGQAVNVARSLAADFAGFCREKSAIAESVARAGAAASTDAQAASFKAGMRLLTRAIEKVTALRARVQARYPALLQSAADFGTYDGDLVNGLKGRVDAGRFTKLRLEAESDQRHLTLLARKLLVLDQDLSVESARFAATAREYGERWKSLNGQGELAAAEARLAKSEDEGKRLDEGREGLARE